MISANHRRAWGLGLLASILGFSILVGLPAAAHKPIQNNQHFAPDEFNGDGNVGCAAQDPAPNPPVHCAPAFGPDPTPNTSEGEIVSDANDGFGEAYELRSLTDTTAAFYDWYSCSDGQSPALQGAACQPIATDPTPVVSVRPPSGATFHAWSGSWNIGGSGGQEGSPRDLFGSACASDARQGGPPIDGTHCTLGTLSSPGEEPGDTFANNVHVDDASTTDDHGNTTSGRIHTLVEGSGTDQRIFTHPAVHGAGLRNGQTITIIGFTSSPSVDAVGFCWDRGSNATTANDAAPNGSGGVGSCTHFVQDLTGTAGGGTTCHPLAPAVSGADCWVASLSFPDINSEFGVSMIEFDDGNAGDGISESGAGDCALDTRGDATADGDDCQLDRIYVSTTATGQPTGTPTPTASPSPSPTGPPRPGACTGTVASDILIGTVGDDVCRGLAGNDTIRTLAGHDVASGGRGNDTVRTGGGNDTGRGGAGIDLVACGPGNDTGVGGPSDDKVHRSCEVRRSV